MQKSRWVGRSGVLVTALAALALGVASLGLAACGGDGDEEPGAQGSPAAEATAEAPEEAPAEATEAMPEEEPTAAEEAAADAGEIDACSLLTKEEVEAVLGEPVGEPTQEVTPPVAGCDYETEGFNSVSVILTTWPDAEQAADAFQMGIDINDYPEVSGIGDRAFDARPAFGLDVLKGKYDVSVDIFSDMEDDAEWAAINDLAAKAVDRLP